MSFEYYVADPESGIELRVMPYAEPPTIVPRQGDVLHWPDHSLQEQYFEVVSVVHVIERGDSWVRLSGRFPNSDSDLDHDDYGKATLSDIFRSIELLNPQMDRVHASVLDNHTVITTMKKEFTEFQEQLDIIASRTYAMYTLQEKTMNRCVHIFERLESLTSALDPGRAGELETEVKALKEGILNAEKSIQDALDTVRIVTGG